jgi:hypothetical protein
VTVWNGTLKITLYVLFERNNTVVEKMACQFGSYIVSNEMLALKMAQQLLYWKRLDEMIVWKRWFLIENDKSLRFGLEWIVDLDLD